MQEGILIQHHAPPLFRSSQNKSIAICQPAIPVPSLFGIFSYLSITSEGISGPTSGSESSCSPRYILKTGFPFQESGAVEKRHGLILLLISTMRMSRDEDPPGSRIGPLK